MSVRKAGFQPGRMPPEEAEEFMALLLAAQKGDHECAFSRYFRKIGTRMMTQYLEPKEGKPE